MWWIGFSMSAVVVLFLLLDAGMKLAAVRPVLEAGQQIGYPGAGMARKLGALLLICTLSIYIPAHQPAGRHPGHGFPRRRGGDACAAGQSAVLARVVWRVCGRVDVGWDGAA